MRGINKILLENILPAHVAEHYLLRAQGVAGVLREANVRVFYKIFRPDGLSSGRGSIPVASKC